MICYRYLGGGWHPGIPARDLSEADLAKLTAEQLAAVTAGNLYEEIRPQIDRRHNEYQDELDLSGSATSEE